jgi:hypothetical protein
MAKKAVEQNYYFVIFDTVRLSKSGDTDAK